MSSPARATCNSSCDGDQDGYKLHTPTVDCGTCAGAVDCDDALSAVNPGASEDGDDTRDNDCDGSRMIRRDWDSGLVTATGSGLAVSR